MGISMTRSLAGFTVNLSYSDIPPEVAELGKTRILDAWATAIAGHDLPWSRIAVKLVEESHGKSSIFGYTHRVSAIDAALVNGVLIHSTNQEDWALGGHPGLMVLSAALAVAEEIGSSGTETVTSIVCGYEVSLRIALGLVGRLHPGFRVAPIVGIFGAAAAAGRLLKLSEDEMTAALGFAANFGTGLGECYWAGTMEGLFQVGMAARNGIMAVLLAKAGATASETALEGKDGFYRAFTGNRENAGRITTDLGPAYLRNLKSLNISIGDLGKEFLLGRELLSKYYPACGCHQAAIDLAVKLRQQYSFEAKDIERVIYKITPRCKNAAGDDFAGPYSTPLQAQLSGQFCVASVLLGKPVESITFFSQQYDNPEVFALAKKIDLIAERERSLHKPRIEVFMKDGREFSAEEDRSPILSAETDKMKAKFQKLASTFLGVKRVAEIIDSVLDLENVKNITELTNKLR